MTSETSARRVHELQYSIASLQDKHSRTLKDLYDQIHRLQNGYADLTNKVTDVESRKTEPVSDEDLTKYEILQKGIDKEEEAIKSIEDEIEVSDNKILFIESRLKKSDDDNEALLNKYRLDTDELELKLKTESEHLAYVTTQLHKLKIQRYTSNAEPKPSSRLAFIPSPPSSNTPRKHRRIRKSVLSIPDDSSNALHAKTNFSPRSSLTKNICTTIDKAVRPSKKDGFSEITLKDNTGSGHKGLDLRERNELSPLKPLPPIESPRNKTYSRKSKYKLEVGSKTKSVPSCEVTPRAVNTKINGRKPFL